MNSDSPTEPVRVDFHNAYTDGFVRLNNKGAVEDLARLGIQLTEGLMLRITDGEVVVASSVCKPGAEGVWRAKVDWQEIFRLHAARK